MILMIPGSSWVPNSIVRLNGTPANTQSWRVEGQEASNSGTPGVPAQSQPSVDAIQEVAIQTSNFAAEYGQAGGGVFNVTMKSGTNQFHGTAYEYLVNEAFNSGNPFTDIGTNHELQRRERTWAERRPRKQVLSNYAGISRNERYRWDEDNRFGGGNKPDHTESLRSEEHTSELQSQSNLVCRLLLEKKKKKKS